MISPLNNRNQDENKPKRDEHGWLLPGHHIGRKKGSLSKAAMLRNRLIRTIKTLDAEEEYQGDYILWFARKHPEKFMALVASLLPKHLKIETDYVHAHIAVMDLPEAERAKVFAECRRRIVEIRGEDGCKLLPCSQKDHHSGVR